MKLINYTKNNPVPLIKSFKINNQMSQVNSASVTPYNRKSKKTDVLNKTLDKHKDDLIYDDEGQCISHASIYPENISNYINDDSIPQKTYLLKSIFPSSMSTVLFPYPRCCEEIRNFEKIIPMPEEYKLKYRITESVCAFHCIISSLETAGFVPTDGPNWNILWSAPLKPEVLKNLCK